MGIELTCVCEKCGYEFESDVGVGFLYPKVYVETIDAMKEGRFGQAREKNFLRHFQTELYRVKILLYNVMIVKNLWLFQNYRYMFLKKDMILQSQIEKNVGHQDFLEMIKVLIRGTFLEGLTLAIRNVTYSLRYVLLRLNPPGKYL